jgi:tRNA-binding EMAP/Myf-like protein
LTGASCPRLSVPMPAAARSRAMPWMPVQSGRFGVESRGMLCSGSELGLSDDHDGILDLPADAAVGQAAGGREHGLHAGPRVRRAADHLHGRALAGVDSADLTLSVGVIRGVESRGMLCSGSELGLSDDHDGILDPRVRRAADHLHGRALAGVDSADPQPVGVRVLLGGPRHLRAGQEHHPVGGRDPRRREPRHAVLGLRARLFMPARAFGAPQTTCTGAPSPVSTVQTRSRSAFGSPTLPST